MGDFENTKDDLIGKAKEAAGSISGNEQLENEGKADQVIADVKQTVDNVVDAVKDKANDIIGGLKG